MKVIERINPYSSNDFVELLFHFHRYTSMLEFVKNKIVLDATCGEGYGSNVLSKKAKKVYGIDIDKNTIKKAKEKYQKKNLHFLVSDVTKTPFKNGFFDVVVSFETIEHLNQKDGILFLKEIKRVLNKNGVLIISTPNRERTEKSDFINQYHLKEYKIAELKKILNAFFKYNKFFFQEIILCSILSNDKSLYLKKLKFEENLNYKQNRYSLTKKDITNPFYFMFISTDSENVAFGKNAEAINSIYYDIKRNYLNYLFCNYEKIEKENKLLKSSIEYLKLENQKLFLNFKRLENENKELNKVIYSILNARFFKICLFFYNSFLKKIKKLILKN